MRGVSPDAVEITISVHALLRLSAVAAMRALARPSVPPGRHARATPASFEPDICNGRPQSIQSVTRVAKMLIFATSL